MRDEQQRGEKPGRAQPRYRLEARLSEKLGAATAPTVSGSKSVSTVFQNG
jgi:hypothetical protein